MASFLTRLRICSASSARSVSATQHIERVRPAVHLIAGDGQHVVVVLGQQQALDRAAALGVDPFAHQHRRRLLDAATERIGDGIGARARVRRAGARRAALRLQLVRPQRSTTQPQVLGRGAAAAAHDIDAELADELGQLVGHGRRLQRVDRLAAHVERHAGVGDHRDGQAAVLGQVADRLAHVLRARCCN